MIKEPYLFEVPLQGKSKADIVKGLTERAKSSLKGIGHLSVVYVTEREGVLNISTIVEAPLDTSLTYTLYEIGGSGCIVSLEE